MTGIPKRVGAGCGVVLLRDGKVLLGHRHEDPEKAQSALHGEGTWSIPGGKFDFGDTLGGGAVREVAEETGIEISTKDLKVVSISSERVPDAHFITLGFVCENFKGEPKIMEPEEITEWRWFDIHDLPEPMFFPAKKVINNYLSGKMYNLDE